MCMKAKTPSLCLLFYRSIILSIVYHSIYCYIILLFCLSIYLSIYMSFCPSIVCVCLRIKSGFIIRIPAGSTCSFSKHLRAISEFPSNLFSFTGMCVAVFHTLNHSVSSPLFSLHYSLYFLFFCLRKSSRICHMTE